MTYQEAVEQARAQRVGLISRKSSNEVWEVRNINLPNGTDVYLIGLVGSDRKVLLEGKGEPDKEDKLADDWVLVTLKKHWKRRRKSWRKS